ncbi:unnamed protein product [Closterium sp. Yama58-4]|nr:unnamed protein product [Closterium sp. Yama58-4]
MLALLRHKARRLCLPHSQIKTPALAALPLLTSPRLSSRVGASDRSVSASPALIPPLPRDLIARTMVNEDKWELKPHPVIPRGKPLVFMILDGWGENVEDDYNAIYKGNCPHIKALRENRPNRWRTIKAHGKAVGLPSDGDMGNSEVGHNAMGAGKVINQGAALVDAALETGDMFKSEGFNYVKEAWDNGGTLHMIGLLSDGGVHSRYDQVIGTIHGAWERGAKRVRVHVLTDGRDVPDGSSLQFVAQLEKDLELLRAQGCDAKIASGGGRMRVTMDRYEADWKIVERGWHAHVLGDAPFKFKSALEALKKIKEDDPSVNDQYYPPWVIVDDEEKPVGPVVDGDAVVIWNFRADRVVQISKAFEYPDFHQFDRVRVPKVHFAGMMQYDGDLKLPAKFLVAPPVIENTSGQYLVKNGVRTFACSETQKFGHVTFFWNGNRSGKLDDELETYYEVPSDKCPFNEKPKMKAREIAAACKEAILSGKYDYIRLNLANGDMVGHTGVFDAVLEACEAVDGSVKELLEAVEQVGGIYCLTADHGNCDDMVQRNSKTHQPILGPDGKPEPLTSHTLAPVPIAIGGPGLPANIRFRQDMPNAGLANVTATFMNLLGFEAPEGYEPSPILVCLAAIIVALGLLTATSVSQSTIFGETVSSAGFSAVRGEMSPHGAPLSGSVESSSPGSLSNGSGILIPRCDQRQYEALELPNGLTVLLISDPETDKAAAAMDVGVGSLSDPDDAPGLAHFLEHMLFYASEKYPIEDSYSDFLNKHSGRSNAYTAAENTNYQFDVAAEFLDEALDRFAQFFICPLMSADATNREINAVHSEHTKNLISDPWRINQLQKSFCSPQHPFYKFNVGSLETLKEVPEANGRDIRQELITFYDKYYSANLMHLVVYGKDSLASLRSMVESRFALIPNKVLQQPEIPADPCGPEYTKRLVRAVPVAEGHKLELIWPTPADQHLHRATPTRYLGHLIGHEGHGSLFALLKKKGWATALGAGRSHSSKHYAFFAVNIDLTDLGHEHAMEVAELVFRYIGLIQSGQGIQKWIFDELAAVCATKFHFQDKQQPFFYTSAIAAGMQLYPREDWLAGASLPRDFDPNALADLAKALTPDNVQIFWLSKKFEAEATEEERWYKTKHSAQTIPDDLLQRWRDAVTAAPDAALSPPATTPPVPTAAAAAAAAASPSDGAAAAAGDGGSSSELHLPAPNEFVPTDLDVLTPPTGKVSPPTVIHSTPMLRLWHKPDTLFGLPKAVLFMQLASPEAYTSPRSALLTRLFASLLQDALNAYAYDAEIAGLNYSIVPSVHGIQISAWGYSHKLLVLVSKIIDRLVTYTVDADRFHVIKEKEQREFENFRYDQPYAQALYSTSLLLAHRRWHFSDYLAALPALQPEHLAAFLPSLLSHVSLELFASGNIAPTDAIAFAQETESRLRSSPIAAAEPPVPAQWPEMRMVRLGDGSAAVLAGDNLNPDDENSALVFYLQVCQDGETMVLPAAPEPGKGEAGTGEATQAVAPEAEGGSANGGLTVEKPSGEAGGVSVRAHVVAQLLVQVLERDVFYELRTVQQLGYIVFLMSRNENAVHGITFIIQSNVKSASDLDGRVEAFLQAAESKLAGISEEEFQTHVAALVAKKQERKKNLVEEANVMWKEIDDAMLAFDRIDQEVAELRFLRPSHVAHFFATVVKQGAPNRRLLSVQVQRHEKGAAPEEAATTCAVESSPEPAVNGSARAAPVCAVNPVAEASESGSIKEGVASALSEERREVIENIYDFKRSQALYPSLKGRAIPPSIVSSS